MDDLLVTIRLRVAVTDRAALLSAWQDGDPKAAATASADPDLALALAVQDAVPPPDLTAVPGLRRANGAEPFASVRAESWTDAAEP